MGQLGVSNKLSIISATATGHGIELNFFLNYLGQKSVSIKKICRGWELLV
jgi:hypothetical protein